LKFAIAAGGTGGHIYPALSVARALAGQAVVFVGTRGGPEAEIVPRHGYPLRTIPARKIDRRLGPGALWSLAVSAGGVLAAIRLLRGERPGAVLGTGGYVAAPTLLAARLLRIPCAILEADAVPGRANRLLGRLVDRVFVAQAAAATWFPPRRVEVTGLPIRPEIGQGDGARFRQRHALAPERPLLFVFGGSQGAVRLNRAVLAALPELVAAGVQVVHQTGPRNYEAVRAAVPDPPPGYVPLPYLDDMADALAAADLVLCRAGSGTIAELTAAGRPAILVPLPTAVWDHQTHNARAMAEAGAALIVRDAELDGARLAAECVPLLRDTARLQRMAAASRALARPDAAQRIAAALVAMAGGARPLDSSVTRCAA